MNEWLQLVGMKTPFSSKILRKVTEPFFEDEKILFNVTSSIISFFFDLEDFRRDSMGGEVRITGREGMDAHFAFEVEAFLVVGRLGEVKYDVFDSLFKGGWIETLVGAWCDLLLGLKDEWEVTLDAKADATNVDAIIETFFDFEEGSLVESGEITAGSADLFAGDGVMILVEGSSSNLDRSSSLYETFLGVMKLIGWIFLE